MNPSPLSKDELIAVLRDMLNTVEHDDSLEGHITYSCPQADEPDCDFMVKASYRVGNSLGQGGVHMVGES